jgi:hypothetical protein
MKASMITNTPPTQDEKDKIAEVNIEGLFVLCINQEEQIAQFGAYELASRHSLSLKVVEKLVLHKDDPGTYYDDYNPSISLDNLPPGDVFINAPGAAPELKLKVYQSSSLTESETYFQTGKFPLPNDNDAFDYRWIANLDHPKFRQDLFKLPENTYLKMRPSIISRKVQVSHGVLYTGDYADRYVKWAFEALATQNNGQERLWKKARLACKISISIPRHPSIQSIALSIGDSSTANQYALSLPVKSDSCYRINVTNLCHDTEVLDFRGHSDFHYYYNVIDDIPIAQRIDFLPSRGTGTNRTPCDPIYLGGTSVMP